MEDTGPHMIVCATPSRSWTKSIAVFCILCVFEEETSLQCAWLYCAWFAFIVCLIGKIPNQRLNCISLCRKTSDDSGCSNILTPPRPTVSVRRQSCGKSGGQDIDSRKNTYSGGQNENHKQSYSSKRKNLESKMPMLQKDILSPHFCDLYQSAVVKKTLFYCFEVLQNRPTSLMQIHFQ